ncbi:MAG TPA: ABC transporter ATP-binding protein [Candidatus Limiplasma sp.]|nr:ABC transporter ATP-binding protein [Candidatus Limiplasma sp.]
MARIELTNVTKRWGSFYAVDALNLVIEDNAFVTLLGPSGCGKTTTLRMIAGLETPTSGRITIDGVPVFDSEIGINISANHRKVGFLFQNYALWPNMTVYQNISFGLSNIKESMPEVDWVARKAARLAEILAKPQDLLALLRDAYRQNDKSDTDKAMLRLIDTYEISRFSAKEILNLNLHSASDALETAKSAAVRQQAVVDRQKEQAKASGTELSDTFEILQSGQIKRRDRKLTGEEIDLIVRRVARIVKIGMFMGRYPSELSGGQQQRVAIARTLAPGPKVLFMDEPLSNLDAKLRLEMRSELQRLHLQTGSTFIYVTHDQMEAMTLATKICLINNGVLQQYAEPMTVYNTPENLFVADFVGNPSINFIAANGKQQADGSVALSFFQGRKGAFQCKRNVDIAQTVKRLEAESQPLDIAMVSEKKGKHVEKENVVKVFQPRFLTVDMDDADVDAMGENAEFILGVRPEAISIHELGKLEGEVFSAMPAGMETTVRIKIENFLLTGVVFGGVLYKIGEKVRFDLTGNNILLFDSRSGKMLTDGSLTI